MPDCPGGQCLCKERKSGPFSQHPLTQFQPEKASARPQPPDWGLQSPGAAGQGAGLCPRGGGGLPSVLSGSWAGWAWRLWPELLLTTSEGREGRATKPEPSPILLLDGRPQWTFRGCLLPCSWPPRGGVRCRPDQGPRGPACAGPGETPTSHSRVGSPETQLAHL